jgi:hypothetical protein
MGRVGFLEGISPFILSIFLNEYLYYIHEFFVETSIWKSKG